jgi:3-hydroxybutyryl-CoA dehydrogenase
MMVTDLGGMDIWKAVTGQLFPLLAADTATPAAIEEAVGRGDLGSKTGRGIYQHDPEEDQRVKERMAAHFKLEFGQ